MGQCQQQASNKVDSDKSDSEQGKASGARLAVDMVNSRPARQGNL